MIILYVSPEGNKNGDGSYENPMDLVTAKESVRELIKKEPEQNIEVQLRGGNYHIKDTLVFGQHDSLSNSTKVVTWKAYGSEMPILSGGVTLKEWKRAEGVIPGLPKKARGKLWEADLPVIDGRLIIPRTLYQGFRRIPRARTKGFSPTMSTHPEITESIDLIMSDEKFDTLHFEAGAVRKYENMPDAELVIRPSYVWAINVLPIKEIDEERGVLKTSIQATYPMYKLRSSEHHKASELNAWIENVADGMTDRDRFFVNSTDGKIYYWPREAGQDLTGIVAPVLTELIRVEGNEQNPVRNLVFKGLTMTQADRLVWDETSIGLQHDWDLYDAPNALIRLRFAEDCKIEKCMFTGTGGNAIRLDLHCKYNTVESCWIRNIGGTGILLSGYGAGNIDENKNNYIIGNDIGHCAEISWACPGILISQSGHNSVSNNLIHDLPYNGLVLCGPRPEYLLKPHHRREWFKSIRWEDIGDIAEVQYRSAIQNENPEHYQYEMHQVIERFLHTRNNKVEANEVHHVMQLLSDGDAIYLSGTGDHNLIKGNYIHDVITPGTGCHILRPDGSQFHTVIEENILYRCSGTLMTRSLCHTRNNFIINMVNPIDADDPVRRHQPILYFLGINDKDQMRRNSRNLYYQSDYVDNIARFDDNNADISPQLDVESDYNLYYSPLDQENLSRKLVSYQQMTGLEENSVVADPMFLDVENGDFRFHEDSPARALGIMEIDISKVGLRGRNI